MKTEPEMCYNQGKITENFVLAATGHGNYETHTHSDIMYNIRSSDRLRARREREKQEPPKSSIDN